ncbi:MAG: hypothetical protein G01um101420_605 [Parcubacteria group bacterium Gr01-1014_20]|nr:MAG: hypothetical protein G01um101420_605 [Parcubacteria group bacterium Gr01-1014_20]
MEKTVILSLVVILAFHFLAGSLGWYDQIWWLDIIMHMAGGAWVALLAAHLITIRKIISSDRHFLERYILILGAVALVGVLWEFYEYLADVFLLKVHPINFAPNPKLLPDTLSDLLNDFLGGTATVLVLESIKKDEPAIRQR